MDDALPFPSSAYFIFLALLVFARGMDFLSTWIATPNLVLEGNPLAKKLGWKLGALVNVVLCITFAFYTVTAIIISTTSLLVAARNFHQAWLMRTMGEEHYREWFVDQLCATRKRLYLFCLFANTGIYALIGTGVMYFSRYEIPFAIGAGIAAYAVTVLFYTLLSLWRIKRNCN